MKQAEESIGQDEKQEVILDEEGNPLTQKEMTLLNPEYLANREEIKKI